MNIACGHYRYNRTPLTVTHGSTYENWDSPRQSLAADRGVTQVVKQMQGEEW